MGREHDVIADEVQTAFARAAGSDGHGPEPKQDRTQGEQDGTQADDHLAAAVDALITGAPRKHQSRARAAPRHRGQQEHNRVEKQTALASCQQHGRPQDRPEHREAHGGPNQQSPRGDVPPGAARRGLIE